MGDHGVGAIQFLWDLLPTVVEVAFLPVTTLGDPWVLLVGLLLVFWLVDRRAGGATLGLAAGAAGLVVFLKVAFALERPAVGPPFPLEAVPAFLGPLYGEVLVQETHAFPSGHALGATVAWFGGAHLLPVGRRRYRFALATLVVVLVSLSRVVLGVHFLLDVVAGVGFGVVFLAGSLSLADRLPADRWTGVFGVALATGLAALAITGGGRNGQLVVATGVGAILVRHAVGIPEGSWSMSPAGVLAVLGGLCVLFVPLGAGLALGVPGGTLLGMTVGLSSALALPAAIDRVTTERDGGSEGIGPSA